MERRYASLVSRQKHLALLSGTQPGAAFPRSGGVEVLKKETIVEKPGPRRTFLLVSKKVLCCWAFRRRTKHCRDMPALGQLLSLWFGFSRQNHAPLRSALRRQVFPIPLPSGPTSRAVLKPYPRKCRRSVWSSVQNGWCTIPVTRLTCGPADGNSPVSLENIRLTNRTNSCLNFTSIFACLQK